MTPRYTHLIWDWNGTLLDDAWLCMDIMNKLLAARHLPVLTAERYADKFGFPVIDYYAAIGFDFSSEPFEHISTAYIQDYESRKSTCALRNGAMEMLAHCQGLGMKQYVLSASKQKSLVEILASLWLTAYFDRVSGLDDHHAFGKEQVGHQLMQGLALPPGETVMIGDTLHDAAVSKALGIDCLLLPSGHQSKTRLLQAAVPVLEDWEEVQQYLILAV